MALSISKGIEKQAHKLARLKFVQSYFPDATYLPNWVERKYLFNPEFSSKLVNTDYSEIKIISQPYGLYVAPIKIITYSYLNNDEEKHEDIIIGSRPKFSRLAYIKRDYTVHPHKNIIYFSRLSFNIKKNNFDDKILKECQVAIVNFIKEHPNLELDDKHLDARLKKLIVFS